MSCQRVPSCQPPASAAPLASRPRGTREQPQSHTIQTPTPTAGPAAELPVSRGSQSRDNQQRYTCIAQFCRLGVGTQADRLGADWSGERKMAGSEDILHNDARDHPTSLRRPAAMGPGVITSTPEHIQPTLTQSGRSRDRVAPAGKIQRCSAFSQTSKPYFPPLSPTPHSLMLTTARMQSPDFMTSKASLICASVLRCVMNSSTLSRPSR